MVIDAAMKMKPERARDILDNIANMRLSTPQSVLDSRRKNSQKAVIQKAVEKFVGYTPPVVDLSTQGVEPNPGPWKKKVNGPRPKGGNKRPLPKNKIKSVKKLVKKVEQKLQKENVLVKNVSRAQRKPDRMNMKSAKKFGTDCVNFTGKELVATGLTFTMGESGGTYKKGIGLNPTQLGAPRLATAASLFERFYCNHIAFRVILDQASTATGGCIAFWEDDSAAYNSLPSPPTLLQIANSKSKQRMSFNQNTKIWHSPGHITKKMIMGHVENTGRYIVTAGHSSEEAYQGIWVLVTDLTPGGSYTYNIEVEYNFDMWDPVSTQISQLNPIDGNLSVMSITQTLSGGNDYLFPQTTAASGFLTFGPLLLTFYSGTPAHYLMSLTKGYYWIYSHMTGTGIGDPATMVTTTVGPAPVASRVFSVSNTAATQNFAFFKIDCSASENNVTNFVAFQATDVTITSYSMVVIKTSNYPAANPLIDEKMQIMIDHMNNQIGRVPADTVRKVLAQEKPGVPVTVVNGFNYNVDTKVKDIEEIKPSFRPIKVAVFNKKNMPKLCCEQEEDWEQPGSTPPYEEKKSELLAEFDKGDKHDRRSLFERHLDSVEDLQARRAEAQRLLHLSKIV